MYKIKKLVLYVSRNIFRMNEPFLTKPSHKVESMPINNLL